MVPVRRLGRGASANGTADGTVGRRLMKGLRRTPPRHDDPESGLGTVPTLWTTTGPGRSLSAGRSAASFERCTRGVSVVVGVVWPALNPQGKDRPGNVRGRCRTRRRRCRHDQPGGTGTLPRCTSPASPARFGLGPIVPRRRFHPARTRGSCPFRGTRASPRLGAAPFPRPGLGPYLPKRQRRSQPCGKADRYVPLPREVIRPGQKEAATDEPGRCRSGSVAGRQPA